VKYALLPLSCSFVLGLGSAPIHTAAALTLTVAITIESSVVTTATEGRSIVVALT
jgi:hypothetical protein